MSRSLWHEQNNYCKGIRYSIKFTVLKIFLQQTYFSCLKYSGYLVGRTFDYDAGGVSSSSNPTGVKKFSYVTQGEGLRRTVT